MGVDTAAADRLPWLADEPSLQRAQERRSRAVLPWSATALAVVGCVGFWLGSRSVDQAARLPVRHASPSMTIQLPPPSPAVSPHVQMPAPQEVRPAPAPDVKPVPPRDVRIIAPPRLKAPQAVPRPERVETAIASQAALPHRASTASESGIVAAPGAPPAPFVMPLPWNPRIFAGASGRLVQIGAFGSVAQAKRGWWFMVRAYPAMAHLPAVVRPTRNSKGRVFYRFQVGTTSQAHSEVLCQRMGKIRFSCAVVGLPWKAKVER
ncbi:MAG TPA: hypothetical protein VGU01_02230 [Sphingomicrobium sp.]|nr:hypothetical protein [Sphingomicrobium sp.]